MNYSRSSIKSKLFDGIFTVRYCWFTFSIKLQAFMPYSKKSCCRENRPNSLTKMTLIYIHTLEKYESKNFLLWWIHCMTGWIAMTSNKILKKPNSNLIFAFLHPDLPKVLIVGYHFSIFQNWLNCSNDDYSVIEKTYFSGNDW